MPTPNDEQDGELPPPGSRWGAGAQSVLPYLTKSLQAKPANGAEPRDVRPRDGCHPVCAGSPQRPTG
jgi:hypothetical protein